MLKHLGLLEKLNELDISQTKIAEILAVLLNKSAGNLKKDLSQINDDMSELSTRDNYQFLVNFFGKIKLQKQLEETSIILKKVIDEKEKQLVKNNRK